jgi:hypothetical protein
MKAGAPPDLLLPRGPSAHRTRDIGGLAVIALGIFLVQRA